MSPRANDEIVHQVADSLQAPNWTRDGKSLIYNHNGKLYRFDLASREIAEINTDFATSNNNDHVLSFDGDDAGDQPSRRGARAKFSDLHGAYYGRQAAANHGRRRSLLLPWLVARWQMAGVHRRSQRQLRYLQDPLIGGEEVRLTTYEGLDDGPEFSPDGQTIYFNSMRSGKMQIWRMNADGTDQQQVTDDKYNNWFPPCFARWQLDRLHRVPAGHRARRSSVLQARNAAADARRTAGQRK